MIELQGGDSPREQIRSPIRSAPLALAVGAAAIVAVVIMDQLLAERSLLAERPPRWTPVYVARAALLAGGSFALATSARAFVDRRLPLETRAAATSTWLWIGSGVGMAVSVLAAALVLARPDRLSLWVQEDNVVEWLSAAMLFVAAVLVGVAAIGRLRVADPGHQRFAALALLMVSGLLLLVGLEEVSWFQRVLDIESPGFVEGRNQSELNLHNAATDLAENIYYVGAFVFTVAVPYLFAGRRLPGPWTVFSDILPGKIVLFGSVYAVAMVFEMWEVIPMQMVFYFGLYALVTEPAYPGLRRLAAVVLVGVLGSFLIWGSNMGRSWDDTEVRELVIPYGFLLYAMNLVASGSRQD